MRPIYPPPGRLPRITQSQIESYLRCGVRYFLEHECTRRVCTVRMAVGSGVAVGAWQDNRSKLARGIGLPACEIVDASVAAYAEEIEESDCADSRLEQGQGEDLVANAAECYAREVAPKTTGILAAEEPMLAEMGDLEVAGTPDVVTTAGIGDTKVGQPWTLERADRARQLSGYAILHWSRRGRLPSRVWIDSVSRSRSGWQATRWFSVRTEKDCTAFLETARKVREAINAGTALPAPEGAWWCSRKWCPWWTRCPHISRRETNGTD
jgi:hypothetical protein